VGLAKDDCGELMDRTREDRHGDHYRPLFWAVFRALASRKRASPSFRSGNYELSDSDSNVLRSPHRPTGDRGLRAHKSRRISAKAR
jgi:hypothetical protein